MTATRIMKSKTSKMKPSSNSGMTTKMMMRMIPGKMTKKKTMTGMKTKKMTTRTKKTNN